MAGEHPIQSIQTIQQPEAHLPPGPAMSAREQTFAWYARPYDFLEECAARFGETFTLDIRGWGATVCYSNPTAVRDLFSAPSSLLHAGGANDVLRAVLGSHSLLLLDESEHHAQRKLLAPAFHGRRIRSWGDAILGVARDASASWPRGEARPVTELLLDLSRDVITQVVFGPATADVRRDLHTAVARLLVAVGTTVQSADVAQARAALDRILREEFARRRMDPATQRDDVLASLLEAHGAHLDDTRRGDDVLCDEVVTLLMAGHETTATSLAWALVEIAERPEVTSRLRSEIASAGPRPDPMAIASLPYLDAVCKEVLRLRPVVPAVVRKAACTVSIGGWMLPQGVHAAACAYLTHFRPDLYPEPTTFRPERFVGREFAPWEYLPFGGGARRCLGMAFAMFEMKLVLATLLATLDIQWANRLPWRAVRHSVCVAPSERARMTATTVKKKE